MAEGHQRQGHGVEPAELSLNGPSIRSHALRRAPACAQPRPDRPKTIPQVKLEQELEMQRRKEEANCNIRFVANKVRRRSLIQLPCVILQYACHK
jgi:hypothetical protein